MCRREFSKGPGAEDGAWLPLQCGEYSLDDPTRQLHGRIEPRSTRAPPKPRLIHLRRVVTGVDPSGRAARTDLPVNRVTAALLDPYFYH